MNEVRSLTQFDFKLADAEYAPPGHTACAGCGGASLLRIFLKMLGPNVVMTNPASCSGFYARAVRVPLCRALFASGAAFGAGIRAGLDARGETETTVLVWAGDGGTYDIGIQALSAAAERNENLIYVCYDNEGYMMTGMQRSGATPSNAWTTTTPLPHPKKERKKDIVSIMAAHRIPYVATASLGYPEDLVRKIKKAKSLKGTRFFNVISPCPPGWRFPPDISVQLSRMAIQSRIFPLLEIENGLRWVLQEPKDRMGAREFLRLQGRFGHLDEAEVADFEREVDTEWKRLRARVSSVEKLY